MVQSKLFFISHLALILLIPQSDMLLNKVIKSTRNSVKPTKLSCVVNPKRVTNVSCALKAISRNLTEINAYAILLEPLRNITVRLEIFKFYNGYRPFLFNVTENWCEYMAGRKWSPLVKIAAQLLKNTSNLNTTCPIEKYVIVRGCKYVPEYFPLTAVVPKGKYKLTLTVYDDTEIEPYIATISGNVEIEENVE